MAGGGGGAVVSECWLVRWVLGGKGGKGGGGGVSVERCIYSRNNLTNQPYIPSRGAFNFSQAILPHLLSSASASPPSPFPTPSPTPTPSPIYPPTLIFTGATASLKSSAHYSTFSPGKFALRALSQSLAREFGPRGVHVGHAVVDGVVDTELARGGGAGEGVKINPHAVSAPLGDGGGGGGGE